MNSEQPSQQDPGVGNQAVKVSTSAVKPIVTFALIIFTLLIYALQLASEYLTGYDWLFIYGGKINEAILAGEIWRLITPVFLHSSITHIVFNLYALYILGRR
ncbi:MAG: rhomboid family intramembrane serine protease, partial [Chloroflexota bacterium]